MSAPQLFMVERAGEALENSVVQRVWERVKAGDDLSNIAGDEMIEWAVQRYKPHIINGMRRAGMELPEGVEEFSSQSMVLMISEQLDITLAALTPEAIADALDAKMARELGRKLGIELTSLRDESQLKEAAMAAVKEALVNGRPNKLISATQIRKMRSAKAWSDAGLNEGERKRISNLLAQRRWRKRYTWTWATSGGGDGGSDGPLVIAPGEE